ncbi:hypothetical protein V1279_006000 [Bradyrhizobium sp. AZCC 1610]
MTDEAMSPLRRRMIEDMTIRKLAPKTQQGYIRTIKDFAIFLGRSPDTASFEDVRRFQLHLAANGAHIPILNHTVAALRFFFRITLRRSDIIEHTTFLHEPRKLPVVLSPEEVARLVDAAPGLKYKAALSVAYGAGLHRGLRVRCNATASADSSNEPHQDRHLMTASHPRKSDRRTSCLSTGHGRTRSNIQPSSQIVRHFTAVDATRRSSSSRFTVHRLAGAPRLHSHTSSAALKFP